MIIFDLTNKGSESVFNYYILLKRRNNINLVYPNSILNINTIFGGKFNFL